VTIATNSVVVFFHSENLMESNNWCFTKNYLGLEFKW